MTDRKNRVIDWLHEVTTKVNEGWTPAGCELPPNDTPVEVLRRGKVRKLRLMIGLIWCELGSVVNTYDVDKGTDYWREIGDDA